MPEILPAVFAARTNQSHSASLRAASRASAQLWTEVHDTECDRCGRLFTYPSEERLCRRCQRKEENP